MSVKSAHPKPADHGTSSSGKGLDALDRYIIQTWGPRGRFGLWTEHTGLVSPPKSTAETFLNTHLEALWLRDELSVVITVEPPYDPFATVRLVNDHRHLGPESKYKPSHWAWKVVPPADVAPLLATAATQELPEAERAYLQQLFEGPLKGLGV